MPSLPPNPNETALRQLPHGLPALLRSVAQERQTGEGAPTRDVGCDQAQPECPQRGGDFNLLEELVVDDVLLFTVPGEPTAKARARAGARGFYTPQKTADYESLVAYSCREKRGLKSPFKGPLVLSMIAFMPIPKSWSKKQQERARIGQLMHIKRPDLDNLIKSIKDGLNGVAWEDDSQVVGVHAHKVYADKPRVEVGVFKLLVDF